MSLFINKGNAGFASVLNSNYVDKSMLIEHVNGVMLTEARYLCVTRARRFGKSVAVKMLNAYYDQSSSLLKYNDENSLACVLSLAFYTARTKYTVVRELPSGKGFADIVLIPHRNVDSPAIPNIVKLVAIMGSAALSTAELMASLGIRDRVSFRRNYLNPALETGYVSMLYPDNPKRRGQKYMLTDVGKQLFSQQ